jgi:cytochrome bd-type quinol oxidase subunit 2
MTDKRFSFAKLVVVMAIGLLVGAGLCGLDFALAAHGIGKSTQEFGVGPLDSVSLVVMVLSAAGLVLSLAAWFLAAIFGSTGPRDDSDGQQ